MYFNLHTKSFQRLQKNSPRKLSTYVARYLTKLFYLSIPHRLARGAAWRARQSDARAFYFLYSLHESRLTSPSASELAPIQRMHVYCETTVSLAYSRFVVMFNEVVPRTTFISGTASRCHSNYVVELQPLSNRKYIVIFY